MLPLTGAFTTQRRRPIRDPREVRSELDRFGSRWRPLEPVCFTNAPPKTGKRGRAWPPDVQVCPRTRLLPRPRLANILARNVCSDRATRKKGFELDECHPRPP